MITPAVIEHVYKDFRRAMKKLSYPLPTRSEFKQFLTILESNSNKEVTLNDLGSKQLFIYALSQYLQIMRMPDKKEQVA